MAEKPEEKTTTKKKAEQGKPRRLYRSKSDRMISGVCGGLAEYLALDSTLVRGIWVLMLFFAGIGFVPYILAWILVPEKTDEHNSSKPVVNKSNRSLLGGLLLLVIGAWILLDRFDSFDYPFHRSWQIRPRWFFDFQFDLILPLLIIIFGAFYLMKFLRQEKPAKEKSTGGTTMEKKLTRSVSDKMIAGVCGGIASYFNIDPSLVRIGFALLTLAGGGFIGIIAYVVMMIVVPEENVASKEATGGTGSARTKKPTTRKSSSGSAENKEN